MKKLLITLALLSFANSALANGAKQINIKHSFHNYNGLTEYCVEGVAYLANLSSGAESALTPKLLPSGKPATCNY